MYRFLVISTILLPFVWSLWSKDRATWFPVNIDRAQNFSIISSSILDLYYNFSVRRVYIDVWNEGEVFFESEHIKGKGKQGFDFLGWALKIAPKDMEIYAWFEYGLIARYGNNNSTFFEYASQKNWILGNYQGYTWLNPQILEVEQFFEG